MKATAAGFASDAVRLIRDRLPAPAWFVVMLVATGAVLTGLMPAADTNTNIGAALLAGALWIFTFWTSAVVTRFMAQANDRRWAVDGAFLRFLGSQLLVTLFAAILFYIVQKYLASTSRQTSFAAMFAAQVVISLAVLPFAPWFTALAVGDRALGLGGSLGAMKGATLSLAGATLLLVLPVQLLHAVLASIAAKTASMPLRTGLGVIDGLVSALAVVVLPWALFAAAWRFVRGEADHSVPDDLA